MVRTLVGLASVATGLAIALACQPIRVDTSICPNGFLPFDGQTGVALDAVLEIDVGAALPVDLPDVSSGVTLRSDAGSVAIDVEADLAAGVLYVTPRKELRPDTRYWLAGIDWGTIDAENPHWWPGRGFGLDPIEVPFTTESAPTLLRIFDDGFGTARLAFSEPVTADELDGRLVYLARGGVEEVAQVVSVQADGHIVQVAHGLAEPVALRLGKELDIRFENGDRERAIDELVTDAGTVGRFFGEPWCSGQGY